MREREEERREAEEERREIKDRKQKEQIVQSE
jgi:hypothetical protein